MKTIRNKKCKCGATMGLKDQGYHVVYYDGGKQKRKFAGYTLRDARAVEADIKVRKRKGTLWEISPKANRSFQELSDWYLGLDKVKSKRYFLTVQHKLKVFNRTFGATKVNSIRSIDLENYQIKRLNEGRLPSTIDADIKAAEAMINVAWLNDRVSSRAVKTFKSVKKLLVAGSNARDRILTLEEYERLLVELPDHVRPIVQMAFYTGMRKGEILPLTWDKVDLKAGVIRLDAADTKTFQRRNVPIPAPLAKVLRELPSPSRFQSGLVFTYHGRQIKDIRTGLMSACKRAKILYGTKVKGGFVLHDLRHTYNTYARKSGIHDSVTMRITGHASRSMYDRYNTIDSEDGAEAADKFIVYLLSKQENTATDSAGNAKTNS